MEKYYRYVKKYNKRFNTEELPESIKTLENYHHYHMKMLKKLKLKKLDKLYEKLLDLYLEVKNIEL